MTRKHLFRILAALSLGGLIVAMGGTMTGKPSPFSQDQDTKALWAKVDEADKAGLPQTAIDALKRIETLAFARKNDGEALRALTRRIILESVIKGNKPEEKVARLKEEIVKAPAGARTMMKTVLARWYWQYYSRNRWRFINRAATEGADDKDFTTWDLRRIFREIGGLYREILKNEDELKKTPLAAYKDLLRFFKGHSILPQFRKKIEGVRDVRKEQLLGAALLLASDGASYMAGECIVVDGGMLATGVNS